jgi:hypothetical protein
LKQIEKNATQEAKKPLSTQQEFFEENIQFLQKNRSFIGREFLTWLWFVTESQNHLLNIKPYGEIRLFVDDKLVLVSQGGSAVENTLKGGSPAFATEAKISLQSGKLVQEARFVLQKEDKFWSWTIRADDLSFRALKLPAMQEPDPSSHLAERIRSTQLLVNIVQSLFSEFMALRTQSSFSSEIQKMSHWLESKSTLH